MGVSSKLGPKGQRKNRTSRSSKTSWWIMKKKRKPSKKRPKAKVTKPNEPSEKRGKAQVKRPNEPSVKQGKDKVKRPNEPSGKPGKAKVAIPNEPNEKQGKAEGTRPSEPGQPISKQARKRKLKRQEKISKKIKRKEELKVTRAKDKGVDRTDKQLKKRKRRFKKKRTKETDKEEDKDGRNAETESNVKVSYGGREDEKNASDGDLEKDVKTEERRRKRKNANLHRSVKEKAEGGAVTVHKSGDKSGDQDTSPDIDSNWRNLMQSINYQPPGKKRKLEKAKDGKPSIWFDDVDPELMEDEDLQEGMSVDLSKIDPMHHGKGNPYLLSKGSESPVAGLTKYVGLDCEMVGIGLNGKDNMLARVSIVNQYGLCIYDKLVAPQEEVTNFRSQVTGISAKDLKNADEFSAVQEEVSSILKGRILVGHALHNDFKVLLLTHPKSMIRDTSTYKKFKDISKGNKPKLKTLCEMILKVTIQDAEHDSVQDAQAAMKLFMLHRINWEKELGKQCRRKLKVKTNQEAELLISTPSGLPETEH